MSVRLAWASRGMPSPWAREQRLAKLAAVTDLGRIADAYNRWQCLVRVNLYQTYKDYLPKVGTLVTPRANITYNTTSILYTYK